MSQFHTAKTIIGDMLMETGVVLDLTATVTEVFSVGNLETEAVQDDPIASPQRAIPRFAGGSSRNMIVEEFPAPQIPSGWMIQSGVNKWVAEDGVFTVGVNADGVLEWSDETDVIYTAPVGSIEIKNRVACTSFVESGGIGGAEIIVDLGSATGLVTLNFDAYTVPDKFQIEYNGTIVADSGFRGVSGIYDGVNVIAGPRTGSISFTKSTASPTWCKVIVTAPFTGTEWEFTCGCPAAGPPPYTIVTGRGTFTATSTAYGDGLNGGTPFTLDVTYEGGQRETTCRLISEIFGNQDYSQVDVQRWKYGDYEVAVADDGSATFYSVLGIIAERASGPTLDPTGSYAATTYGKTTFNSGEDFFVAFELYSRETLPLYTYLEIDVSAGSLTAVRGPYSIPFLPANTAGTKYLPLNYSNGDGRIIQYHEGPLIWK
jgi:hypothetical protein